jgi:hypothetical protein
MTFLPGKKTGNVATNLRNRFFTRLLPKSTHLLAKYTRKKSLKKIVTTQAKGKWSAGTNNRQGGQFINNR